MADFQFLPEELQLRILECCDADTLATLCLTNRGLYHKSLPILWADIDFQATDEHIGPQWTFLRLCHSLARENPDRWSELGPLVRSLNFLKMPGINIAPDHSTGLEPSDWDFVFFGREGNRTVYDVLVRFPNLERLSLFVKDCWDGPGELEEAAKALQAGLTRLRHVRVGGQIPPYILTALLSRTEQVESLALINLIYSPDQISGPEPVLFLQPIRHRFDRLAHLHLSKLAELDEDYELAGLRWEWDTEQEILLLQEWAGLLDNVHETVVTLKLENRYHAPRVWNEIKGQIGQSEDEDKDAALRRCGTGSSDRCKDVLFPIVNKHEWPALRHVSLMGIHLHDGRGHADPFERMKPRITVEDLPGTLISVLDGPTPMNISPPNGMFDDRIPA